MAEWFRYADGIEMHAWNGRDTYTVRVNGKERGELDSTRDRTGDWWAIPILGERRRFHIQSEAVKYLAE